MTGSFCPPAVWVWSAGSVDDDEDDDIWATAEVQTIEEGPPLVKGGRPSLIRKSVKVSVCKDEVEEAISEALEGLGKEMLDESLDDEEVDKICRDSVHEAIERARKKFYEGSKFEESVTILEDDGQLEEEEDDEPQLPSKVDIEAVSRRARQTFYKKTLEKKNKLSRRSVLSQSLAGACERAC